eukprot:9560547-Alexandrium_andersonii.AAC.1
MSTSSTFQPANLRIADSPSFREAGPENKCRHCGLLRLEEAAIGPEAGSGISGAAATGPGAGTAAAEVSGGEGARSWAGGSSGDRSH